MTRAQQALVGALAGSLAVLSLHPVTRPLLLDPLVSNAPVTRAAAPSGIDLGSAALTFARAVSAHEAISTDSCLTMVEAAQRAAERDNQNAAWPAVEAYFQDKLDNQEAAEAAWRRAASLRFWVDRAASSLPSSDTAWDTYRIRSSTGAGLVKAAMEYARRLDLERLGEDQARWETIAIGLKAWNAPAPVADRLVARDILRMALRYRQGQEPDPSLMTSAATHFGPQQIQELTSAVSGSGDLTATQRQWALSALFAKRLAGATLIVGAVGALVYLAGASLVRFGRLRSFMSMPWCAVLGVATGILIFAMTGLVFPALWGAVVWGGFLVTQDRLWRGEIFDHGPAFRLAVVITATLFCVSLSMAIVVSEPVFGLLDETGLAQNLPAWSSVLRGTTWFAASLMVVLCQVFAYFRRRAPGPVVAQGIKEFGLATMVIGLVASVVLTPVCLAWNAQLSHDLQMQALEALR